MAYLRLTFPSGQQGACSGSLIGARWVLTAGHRLSDETTNQRVAASGVQVLLGFPDITKAAPTDFRAASAVAVMDGYDSRYLQYGVHDVGLVQLAAPAPQFSQARFPRPQDAAAWAPGAIGSVLGWGALAGGNPPVGSPQLQETELTVYSDQACGLDAIPAWNPAQLLCAANAPHYTCFGDSGGPLLFGAPQPIVAGVVSGVSANCDGAQLQTFTELAEPGMNAFVRQHVPLAEIDADPAAPQPGDTVTVASAGTAYPTLRWDLDADGQFDDAAGPAGTLGVDTGTRVVGLQGTDGNGDDERRYVALDVRPRTPVNLAAPAPNLRVREGQPVAVTVATNGGGSGAVAVQALSQTALPNRDFFAGPLAAPLTFARGDASKTIVVPTRDDWSAERLETFGLQLGAPSGQLVAGQDLSRVVTIVDDEDLVPDARHTLHLRGARVALRVKVLRPGKAKLALQRIVRGKVTNVGSTSPSFKRLGRTIVRIKLTRSARRLVRRSHRAPTVQLAATKNGDPMGPPLRRKLAKR
jgi:Trypsin